MNRAKAKGKLVEYRSYIFTPLNLELFKRKVAAGLKKDKLPPSSFGSPLMDAILDTVAKRPGIIAKDVIAILRDGSVEYGLSPIRSDGSAYNAVARLKDRGELEGFGRQGRQLRIGPDAPKHFIKLASLGKEIHLAEKYEAPSGQTAGAS